MAEEEPQVGDDAVRSDDQSADQTDTTESDSSTGLSDDTASDASDTADAGDTTDAGTGDEPESTDPHPDGITTEDVEGTVGAQPAGAEADPDADVSPTGTANVAGTPQSQLSQAPPMADPSGSNVPAPNLRQPLAEGADPGAGAASTTGEGRDPALVDPEKAAVARVEGRTSDASLRAADGPHIDEVPPDITDGPKPSDGGVERYPFPQGGDVDIATISTDAQDGEYFPNLEIEDSVILLEHDLVPERLVGRRALIVDAPRYLVPMDRKDDVWITVRTRDEANATLSIPLAAVEIRKGAVDTTVRG
jgi:hypothetical protein